MAIIEKGTWTLNPTFSSEVNPPINISIKLDGHSSFSYVQNQQAVEVWTRYYLDDQTIAAERLNEIGSSPKIYISSGVVPETQTISDSDLAILQTLGFSFVGEAPGWVEGLPYIKTEDGWKYLSAFQKKA